jgi:CHAT domain-containing protein
MPDLLAELAQRLNLSMLCEQHLQGIEELVIIPHLYLHLTPFAALPLSEKKFGVAYLGDRFRLRLAPSCQILQFCQQRPSKPPNFQKIGTVMANAIDLPFANLEETLVAQLFNIPEEYRLREIQQATRQHYRQLLERVEILHFGHHATSRLDDPLKSSLFLSDGPLTLEQLLSPSWRMAQLCEVYLSACETGLGLISSSTGDILTLATGFLCAGASRVVSSLWSVSDLAAMLISFLYYRGRQQGLDCPSALQQAQICLRNLTGADIKELFESEQVESHLDAQFERARRRLDRQATRAIDRQQQLLKKVYSAKRPFASPFYWAAFTCQGLR